MADLCVGRGHEARLVLRGRHAWGHVLHVIQHEMRLPQQQPLVGGFGGKPAVPAPYGPPGYAPFDNAAGGFPTS